MSRGFLFSALVLALLVLGMAALVQPTLAAPLDPPASWKGTLIESPSGFGQYASMAIHPTTGLPWISYWYTNTNELRLAQYVGVGGNCGDNAWHCSTVSTGIYPTTPITGGKYSRLVFTPEGRPVIAFYGGALGMTLRVAKYICSGILCYWTAADVYNAYLWGGAGDLSLKVGSDGKARIAAYIPGYSFLGSTAYGKLVYMEELGDTSGTGCLTNQWQCDVIETGTTVVGTGKYPSLELVTWSWPFNYIEPHIAYYDAENKDLKYAYDPPFIGSGNCGPGGNSWTCYAVDTSGDVGQYAVLTRDPTQTTSKQWQIAYYDKTNQSLKLAYTVDSGGSCGSGAGAGKWECITIEDGSLGDANGIGAIEGERFFSLATYQGATAIAYYDNNNSSLFGNGTLKWARSGYGILDGGNCGPEITVGLPPFVIRYKTWFCETLDSGSYYSGGMWTFRDVGQYPTIIYNSSGLAKVSYYDVKSGLRYKSQWVSTYLPITVKNH